MTPYFDCKVLVYATKGGVYLGRATFEGTVRYCEIVTPDTSNVLLTKLLASEETTERFMFEASEKIIYGFECYFVLDMSAGLTLH